MPLVYSVLAGRIKGTRGKAHKIARSLGLTANVFPEGLWELYQHQHEVHHGQRTEQATQTSPGIDPNLESVAIEPIEETKPKRKRKSRRVEKKKKPGRMKKEKKADVPRKPRGRRPKLKPPEPPITLNVDVAKELGLIP